MTSETRKTFTRFYKLDDPTQVPGWVDHLIAIGCTQAGIDLSEQIIRLWKFDHFKEAVAYITETGLPFTDLTTKKHWQPIPAESGMDAPHRWRASLASLAVDPPKQGFSTLQEYVATRDDPNKLTPEEAAAVTAFLQRFCDFCEGKTHVCPRCGREVTEGHKPGRSWYVYPCGCRIAQGTVPKWLQDLAPPKPRPHQGEIPL